MPGLFDTIVIERVYAKISPEPNTGCWIWTGAISDTGYGNFGIHVDGKTKTANAHRYIYELEKGPVAEGLELDHLCKNRWCVNPEHLEQVTSEENTRRGLLLQYLLQQNVDMIHCRRGHAYDDANTYFYKGRKDRVWRGCIECRKENSRRHHAKKVSAIRAN